MSYLDKAKELHGMVGQGQLLEAFDKFYHDKVEMIEATGESWKGKAENRKREEGFLASVKEMHGGGVTSINSNEEDKTTAVESWMELTFNDGNRVKMQQTSVQKWEGDQIVHERFYYNPATMGM